MNINKIHLITFSPTKTSLRIGKAVAEGINAERCIVSDLTHDESCAESLSDKDVAVIAMPVYGGHVAPLAMKRIEGLTGNNTPAVIIAVYGNRDYEMALHDMKDFCTKHGFRIIAAGTFIGEHSYSTSLTPIAVGRPNDSDIECAKNFGRRICAKIEAAGPDADLQTIDINSIERPEQDEENVRIFKSTVAGWMKNGTIKPSLPVVDKDRCTQCGICIDLCPTGAISSDDAAIVSAELCIKCCACVKGCPEQARSLDTPFAKLLSQNFTKQKENKTFI